MSQNEMIKIFASPIVACRVQSSFFTFFSLQCPKWNPLVICCHEKHCRVQSSFSFFYNLVCFSILFLLLFFAISSKHFNVSNEWFGQFFFTVTCKTFVICCQKQHYRIQSSFIAHLPYNYTKYESHLMTTLN